MKAIVMVIIVSLLTVIFLSVPLVSADFTVVLEHKEHFQIRLDTLEDVGGLVGSQVGYNLVVEKRFSLHGE